MQVAPIHQSHASWEDQHFTNTFSKRSPKEDFCQIMSKSDQQFQRSRSLCLSNPRNISVKLFLNLTSHFREEEFIRISSWLHIASSPQSPKPSFLMNQNFATFSKKGHPRDIAVKLRYSKSNQWFQRRRFLKNCLENSLWQPEFLMKSNSVNTFLRGPPKECSCKVWSNLAQPLREEEKFKRIVDAEQQTQGDPKSSPWAHCALVS